MALASPASPDEVPPPSVLPGPLATRGGVDAFAGVCPEVDADPRTLPGWENGSLLLADLEQTFPISRLPSLVLCPDREDYVEREAGDAGLV